MIEKTVAAGIAGAFAAGALAVAFIAGHARPPKSADGRPAAAPSAVVYLPVRASAAPAPAAVPSASATPASATPASPQPGASTVSVTPAPVATASAAPLRPGATPGVGAVATLAPAQSPPPVVLAAPDAPPQILSIKLSAPVARGGDLVTGSVETSSNVASVEARVAGRSASMQKTGVGRFALSYRVPHLPFFLHHTYWVQIIARNSAGVAVSSAVPITIR